MSQALPRNEAQPTRQNRQQRRLQKRQARRAAKHLGNQDVLAQAGQHHVAGRLAEAEALYRHALEKNQDDANATACLGALCLQAGRTSEAIELLQRALAIDPDVPAARVNLAIALANAGRQEQADEAMREAARTNPDDPEVQKNYGSWCHKLGRREEALGALERGLASAPKDKPRQKLLGQIYIELNRLDDARQRFEQALALYPGDPELHAALGSLLAQQEKLVEALPHLVRGFPHAGGTRAYQALLTEVLVLSAPEMTTSATEIDYGAELESALLACLRGQLVNAQRLSSVAGNRLWTKHVGGGQIKDSEDGKTKTLHMEGILGDPLLLELLQNVISVNIGLETLLVPLRQTMLRVARKEQSLSREAMLFMASFAMQCHNNSYVFPVSAEELDEVDRLGAEIEQRIAATESLDRAYETQIALYAMYRPIPTLAGFESLVALPLEAWSEPLRDLIQRALINPTVEQDLKKTIPAFGSIADGVSQAVRSQYEENPYPRWISLPTTETYDLAGYVKYGAPWLEIEDPFGPNPDVLIAGSGTGRHPISAAQAMPHARITAIDLSLSSLAYAKRMAQHYGLRNIEFLHGDILDVADLGRDFAVIESSGVLHHMEEPEKGLEALLRILRPGGYFRIGLYSKLARDFVTRARQSIAEIGLTPTPEAIRDFRQRIMMGRETGIADMVRMTDFFDLDSFRDLVFHVQEHQFTIPQMKGILARHELEFLGFASLSAKQYQAFSQRFPGRAALQDMDCWAAFEEEIPDTFISMYQFWCRKTP